MKVREEVEQELKLEKKKLHKNFLLSLVRKLGKKRHLFQNVDIVKKEHI